MRYSYAIAIAATAAYVSAAQAQVTSLPISNLELVMSPSGLPQVRGIMTNNSMRKTGAIFVTFALFDATGTQLGVALANTTSLEPGQSWRMQATSPYSDVAITKVIDVKVY